MGKQDSAMVTNSIRALSNHIIFHCRKFVPVSRSNTTMKALIIGTETSKTAFGIENQIGNYGVNFTRQKLRGTLHQEEFLGTLIETFLRVFWLSVCFLTSGPMKLTHGNYEREINSSINKQVHFGWKFWQGLLAYQVDCHQRSVSIVDGVGHEWPQVLLQKGLIEVLDSRQREAEERGILLELKAKCVTLGRSSIDFYRPRPPFPPTWWKWYRP